MIGNAALCASYGAGSEAGSWVGNEVNFNNVIYAFRTSTQLEGERVEVSLNPTGRFSIDPDLFRSYDLKSNVQI